MTEQNMVTTPMQLLQAAVENKVEAAELSKLMDLQERWQANQARQAFFEAMSAFQAEVPIIKKTKKGDKAFYAPLETVIKTIQPLLDKHKLMVRFDTEQTESLLTAICSVSHVLGHTESNRFTVPLDSGPTTREGKKVMNGAQATASARSYAKRYALGDAFNLAFEDEDEDDDGEGIYEPISHAQMKQIQADLEELDVDKAKFCRFMDIASIAEMPVAKLPIAENFISAKRAKTPAGAAE